MYDGDMKKATKKKASTLFAVELDRENDGRWIAEIPDIPGAMAYGTTKREALARAYAVALRTLADTVEQKNEPTLISHLFDHGVARS